MAQLQGKTVVLTGATSGIGAEAALLLARAGASLVAVGRDPRRGEALLRRLPGSGHRSLSADLSLMGEVRRVAGEIRSVAPRIDVLVNNAGAIFAERRETAEGLERTFALNHMAYFLLTQELLPSLRAAAPSRIIVVASEAHRGATLDFDDLQNRRGYRGWRTYRRSKLANLLFTQELARRLAGSGVAANALHPGFVASRFGDENGWLFRTALGIAKRALAIRPEDAAATILDLAEGEAGGRDSGGYYVERMRVAPAPAAHDEAAARRLWEESARLAGG
jgi:NAD(P)-dependent dehydrogenase (short-subunit alcohol dehydrogenase family)